MTRLQGTSPVVGLDGSISRRRRALSAALVAAPFMGATSSPANAQSLQTIKMVAQNPFQLADYPALVAERTGVFAKHGIKAEFISVTNSILPLLSGDADMTTVGSLNGIVPIARKQDFQFVAVSVPRLVLALLVRPDSPVVPVAHRWPETMRALRGKKLGVTVAGAFVDNVGRWLSSAAGMTPDKDIIVHPAGDAGLLLANLEKGVYDAALQLSPIFELAQQRKIAVSVMDFYKGEGPPEARNFPIAAPATRRTFAEKNPDLVNRYLVALQEAVDLARKPENRGTITNLVATELKVDPKTLDAPIDTFIGALGSVKFSRSQWDTTVRIMKINGQLKEDVAYEDGVYAGSRA